MKSVRSELALANAQELINVRNAILTRLTRTYIHVCFCCVKKTNEKCFLKCIAKPGTSLSSSEQACLTNCLARYMEACKCTQLCCRRTSIDGVDIAVNIVSRTYLDRIGKERSATVGGLGISSPDESMK